MSEDEELMTQIALEIRELLFAEASYMMQGAMVASPVECLAFAKWWIQREKGIKPDEEARLSFRR